MGFIAPKEPVVLVELCAGSGALARYLTGGWRLVSYAGSKDGYAAAIVERLELLEVQEIVVADPGLWYPVWVAISQERHYEVAEVVEQWCGDPPRGLYDYLRGASFNDNDVARSAARSLCLLAGTHGGHERGGFKGPHKLRPNVDGYIPARQTIAKRLREIPRLPPITVYSDALDVPPSRAVCYIDPPYRATHRYLHHLERDQVVEMAHRWHAAGAVVAISEAEKIAMGRAWHSDNLTDARVGQFRKNTRTQEEWLTWVR